MVSAGEAHDDHQAVAPPLTTGIKLLSYHCIIGGFVSPKYNSMFTLCGRAACLMTKHTYGQCNQMRWSFGGG